MPSSLPAGSAGWVVFVHQGDVVEHIFLIDIMRRMPLQNHRQLVGVGRVVADAVGDQAGLDMAVAVFVLQAFAVQRGAAGSAAQQEAARAGSPAAQARSPMRWKPNIE